MKSFDAVLAERLQQKNQTKIQTLADRAMPQMALKALPLSEPELEALQKILTENQTAESEVEADFSQLRLLTQELKTIQTQAIILHGERIKRAAVLLKSYKEGAFTQWLLAVYGNRQTPYNFLQYYEFYLSLTEMLRPKLLDMPKQAVYTLASRSGSIAEKEAIVGAYHGEPKHLLLAKIRTIFPLAKTDKRRQKFSDSVILTLSRLVDQIDEREWNPTSLEKEKIKALLKALLKEIR